MFLIFSTILIAVVSVVMALLSFKNIQKGFSSKETKESLRKERVVFHAAHSSKGS